MGESAEGLLERAEQLFADDRMTEARTAVEQAFTLLKDAGRNREAAVAACFLVEIHSGPLGNDALANGWSERARRLLEAEGPCLEWAHWELARMACDRLDIDELEAGARRALDLARSYGDVGLEARALADLGLALVTQGRRQEGFACADEALAMLSGGEVVEVQALGTTLCALLTTGDRAGDVARVEQALRVANEQLLEPLGGRPRILVTHCRLAVGGALCTAGRWDEGEAALLSAVGGDGSAGVGHRIDVAARLATLRVDQGRIDEAAELLVDIEDTVPAAWPTAAIHLRRGEAALAAVVLRTALKRLVNDVLRGAPLAALLVEAELACGDRRTAGTTADLLRAMATAVEHPPVAALSAGADGRLALHDGDSEAAVACIERALDHLDDGTFPMLAASLHLQLAQAQLGAGDHPAAVVAARRAHAAAVRLQATGLRDEAAAALRDLGVAAPRGTPAVTALAKLTAREMEVLAGIQRGDSNAQIAAALYLSPKTVEHHVSRILAKLGVRTRAEAATLATRSGG